MQFNLVNQRNRITEMQQQILRAHILQYTIEPPKNCVSRTATVAATATAAPFMETESQYYVNIPSPNSSIQLRLTC